MSQNFTDSVTEAIQSAFATAQNKNQTEVTENHLLWAFLENPEGYFYSILSALNTNPSALLSEVKASLERTPTFSGTPSAPSPARNLQTRIVDAEAIAKSWNDTYTGSDHFLLSYWKNGGEPISKWKKSTGISTEALEQQIKK